MDRNGWQVTVVLLAMGLALATIMPRASAAEGGMELLRVAQIADEPVPDASAEPNPEAANVPQSDGGPVKTEEPQIGQNAAPEENAGGEGEDGQAIEPGQGALDLKLSADRVTLEQLYRILESLPEREELRLSLDTCLQMALDANQDIQVAEYEPLKTDGEIMAAKGEFDPQLVLSGSFAHSESLMSSQLQAYTGASGSSSGDSGLLGSLSGLLSGDGLLGGLLSGDGALSGLLSGEGIDVASLVSTVVSGVSSGAQQLYRLIAGADSSSLLLENDQQEFSSAVQGKLPYGTQYEIKLQLTEEESTYNSFVPEWSGGVTLSLTQPLLKGRGLNANLARVRRAKNSRLAAESQLEQQVMNTMAEVTKAYWDLTGAIETLGVRRKSLENAERLHQINVRKLEVGTGAKIEVVQAKAGVASRLSDVISAESQVRDAEDRLKQLLDMRDQDLFVPVEIVPTERPNMAGEFLVDEAASIQLAFENRPEMRSAALDVDSAEIERKRAANDMLPQLDLQGSYYRGGRGAKTRTVFEGIEYETDMSYSVKLEGTIPITNRVGRGTYTQAQMTKRQAEQRLQQTKQELALGVRNAARQVTTNRTLVESNRRTVALQETNVTAEEKRLKVGLTTSYDVLQQQEELASAQAQEVQARINYVKALTDLELAEGVLLTKLGIAVEPPERAEAVGFVRSFIPPAPR